MTRLNVGIYHRHGLAMRPQVFSCLVLTEIQGFVRLWKTMWVCSKGFKSQSRLGSLTSYVQPGYSSLTKYGRH